MTRRSAMPLPAGYEQHLFDYAQRQRNALAPGDEVYIRSEINLWRGVVLSLHGKSAKISLNFPSPPELVPYGRIAKKGVPVVLVWETWKGRNGAGGYRFDDRLYPEVALPPESIARQTYLAESAFGSASPEQKRRYLENARDVARADAAVLAFLGSNLLP